MIEYKDHPGSPFEEFRQFDILAAGGDYFLIIGDAKQSISFRFCISGGFEHSHPKTTMAIAKLYQAMEDEK